MKLSICMMVKNESKWLGKCLQSLQPLREALDSELIIVDTGSSDGTIEIAKGFTDKLYFHEWNNDFSAMRNITIQYAVGEWILIIDGDEILEQPQAIIDFLGGPTSETHNAATFYVKNFTTEHDWSNFSAVLGVRLFKNTGDFRYEGTIHNQPVFQGPAIGLSSLILHYGYLATDAELMERKFQRTSAILKSELEKDPENIYYLYQLSVSYGMHHDYPSSLPYILKAYELCRHDREKSSKHMYVYTHLAVVYLLLQRFQETEDICKASLPIRNCYIDIYHYMAEAQFNMEKNEEAVQNYMQYLHMVENYQKLEKDSSVIDYTLGKTDQAYFNLCGLWKRMNRDDKALEFAVKVTSARLLESSIPRVIDLCLLLKEYNRLYQYYQERILRENKNLMYIFQEQLEMLKAELSQEEQKVIARIFATGEDQYAVYNRIYLLKIEAGKLRKVAVRQVYAMGFLSLPAFYGELLYILMQQKYTLAPLFISFKEESLNRYFEYLSTRHADLSEILLKYLRAQPVGEKIAEMKLNKVLSRYVLILGKKDGAEEHYALGRYLTEGIAEIQAVYQPAIIDQEMVDDIPVKEHVFLLYMCLANQQKIQGKGEGYLSYVRKAGLAFPGMQKHLRMLIEDEQQSTAKVKQKPTGKNSKSNSVT